MTGLHMQTRNIIAVLLVCAVMYLAYIGIESARNALVTAFLTLGGALWGEIAALKRPGIDGTEETHHARP